MHALEPVPVLAEPGMAIRGGLGQQAERGAAVGSDSDQLLPHRLFAEQGEGELIAGIEKRNGRLGLASAVGNSPHFFGVVGSKAGDGLAPPVGLDIRIVALKARGREAAEISLDVLSYFLGEPAAVREAAGMRVARGRQERYCGHGCSSSDACIASRLMSALWSRK
jgi:hypothetical protein